MKKILLDTNVLLNSVVLPFSYSYKVIKSILDGYAVGYISENSILEAHKRIEEAYQATGINIKDDFDVILQGYNLNVLTSPSKEESKHYDRVRGQEDKALAALANKNDLIICTNDVDDFRDSEKYSLTINTPKDLAFPTGKVTSDFIFGGCFATRFTGAIYIHISSIWSTIRNSDNHQDLHCIIDYQGIAGLYFSIHKKSIVFIIERGPTLSVPLPKNLINDNELKIVASYDCTEGAALFIGYAGNKSKIKTIWKPKKLSLGAGITFANGKYGDCLYPMSLHFSSSFFKSLTEKGANNILGGKKPALACERFSLEEAISFIYS